MVTATPQDDEELHRIGHETRVSTLCTHFLEGFKILERLLQKMRSQSIWESQYFLSGSFRPVVEFMLESA